MIQGAAFLNLMVFFTSVFQAQAGPRQYDSLPQAVAPFAQEGVVADGARRGGAQRWLGTDHHAAPELRHRGQLPLRVRHISLRRRGNMFRVGVCHGYGGRHTYWGITKGVWRIAHIVRACVVRVLVV